MGYQLLTSSLCIDPHRVEERDVVVEMVACMLKEKSIHKGCLP